MTYEFLPHTADVKILVKNKSLENAFSDSALALKETMCEKIKVAEKIIKKIEVQGNDLKSLLYNFLEEFLYLLDAENFLLSKIKKLQIDEKNLLVKAEIVGDSANNYEFTNDVKAITYSDMIIQKDEEFKIQFVLDV